MEHRMLPRSFCSPFGIIAGIILAYGSLLFIQTSSATSKTNQIYPWWRHQMETFSALLALCAGNSLVTGEFPTQRPVTRNFNVFLDLCLNKQLSKQWRRRWFGTPSRSLGLIYLYKMIFNVDPDFRSLCWLLCANLGLLRRAPFC